MLKKACCCSALAILIMLQFGCHQLNHLNPILVAEWREDERMGPTFYQRLEEFESIRGRASGFSPSDRAHMIGQVQQIYRDDVDPLIREEAVKTLAVLGNGSGDVGVLGNAFTDKESNVRIAACRSATQIGGAQAAVKLAQVIGGDNNHDVKLAAAREMANFNDKVAIDALGTLLHEDDPALQYRAMQSLKQCTGKDFGDSTVAWREFVAGGTPAVANSSPTSKLFGWFR
jgi:hypothetical protein